MNNFSTFYLNQHSNYANKFSIYELGSRFPTSIMQIIVLILKINYPEVNQVFQQHKIIYIMLYLPSLHNWKVLSHHWKNNIQHWKTDLHELKFVLHNVKLICTQRENFICN